MNIDIPIGTKFYANDLHVVAVADDVDYDCDERCALFHDEHCYGVCCEGFFRHDKTSVHFEFVEGGEE